MELVAHGLLAEVLKSLGRYEEALLHREAMHADPRADLQPRHRPAHQDAADLARHACRPRPGRAAAGSYDRARAAGDGADAGPRRAALRGVRAAGGDRRIPRPGFWGAFVEGRRAGLPSWRCSSARIVAWAEELRLAGRLHDVGKVGVPDSILQKPGALTDAEFEIMKTHTTVGATVFAGSRSTLIQLAAEVAISHHERWDGSGYPVGCGRRRRSR